jgi:fructose/tagatose bisphosphate aldolase
MYALREVLAQAQAAGAAVGHFNVADLVLLKAVFAAARELRLSVLVSFPHLLKQPTAEPGLAGPATRDG